VTARESSSLRLVVGAVIAAAFIYCAFAFAMWDLGWVAAAANWTRAGAFILWFVVWGLSVR
jgi:hypothetical protein